MQTTLKNIERASQKRRRKKRLTSVFHALHKRAFIFLAIVFIIAAFLYGLFESELFKVTTVSVEGIYSNAKFNDEIQHWRGKNLLLFNAKTYTKHLQTTFSELTNVRVSKRLPHTIVVSVYQREPVALLVTLEIPQATDSATPSARPTIVTGKYHLDAFGVPFAKVDEEGVVTIEASKAASQIVSSLPLFFYPKNGSITMGQKIDDPFITQAIAVSQKSASTPLQFSQYTKLTEHSFEAKMSNGLKVFFSNDKDVASQLAALQMIYESSTIDKRAELKTIDVRFAKPVLTF